MLSCRPGPGPCGRAREARDDRDVGGASLHFSDFTHVHCARPGSASALRGRFPFRFPASAIARTPRFVRSYTGRCISFLMYKDMRLSNCVLVLRSALLSEISQSSRREERIPLKRKSKTNANARGAVGFHPTGRGEARPSGRKAEPEHLETRVWGVSGPVRFQEQNRTDERCSIIYIL